MKYLNCLSLYFIILIIYLLPDSHCELSSNEKIDLDKEEEIQYRINTTFSMNWKYTIILNISFFFSLFSHYYLIKKPFYPIKLYRMNLLFAIVLSNYMHNSFGMIFSQYIINSHIGVIIAYLLYLIYYIAIFFLLVVVYVNIMDDKLFFRLYFIFILILNVLNWYFNNLMIKAKIDINFFNFPYFPISCLFFMLSFGIGNMLISKKETDYLAIQRKYESELKHKKTK